MEGYSGDGGPALDAELNMPTGLLFQPDGQLVIADHRNQCIRHVNVAGVISRIAGTCTKHGEKGDGGPALDAKMNDPIGITLDEKGDLIIADEQNGVVRKVNPSGTISLFAGGGTIPVETAPNGTRATDLQLSHPSYVLADGAGDVYLSDFLANVVIEIGRDGRITRIAGTGVEGFSGDCGKATAAKLDFPTGLARDTHGQLFISDAFNNRVRMVDSAGTSRPSPAAGRPAWATARTPVTVGRTRRTQRPGRTRVRRRGEPVHLGSGQRPSSHGQPGR